jgi:glycosyltransferase involved in cell wall biosynthesis
LKKIFISIPWFSPAFKAGGPVQSIAHMVNELSEGYTFYIFCSNSDLDGLPLDITLTNEWVPYNAYTQVWYATRKERSERLLAAVKQLQPDYLYMVGFFSWHFTLVPLFFCKGPKKILSVRGMLHPGALQQKAAKKKIFLQWMKWLHLKKRCSFHATDQAEAKHIEALFGPAALIHVAGNFPRIIPRQPALYKEAGQLHLISIGLLSPMKNILLVLQAMVKITARVQYDIYGPVKDRDYWQQCLEQVKQLPANINVQYHKEVRPAAVAEKLGAAHVFILPSKSENFGHAIFEALSAGLPVICSANTPWNGLEEAHAGMNVTLQIDALTHAINAFAGMKENELETWRLGAVRYAAKALDMATLKRSYDKMFERPVV